MAPEVRPKSARLGESQSGFFIFGFQMRSTALPSNCYGDPMKVLEQKQQQAANAENRAEKRRTLTVKPGWSEARKRAEALFEIPAAASR